MKKGFKKLFYLFMIGAVMYAPSVMALTCQSDNENLRIVTSNGTNPLLIDLQIPRTVHLIITILKIAIPVILVILGMLDLFKGITAQKEDEIKKAQSLFVKRLIAAILVFFVTTIVQLVISFASKDSDSIMHCSNCFINGKCDVKE